MKDRDCQTERTSGRGEPGEKTTGSSKEGRQEGFRRKVPCASVGPVDEDRKSSLAHRGLFVPL